MLQKDAEEENLEDVDVGEYERDPVPSAKWKGWGSFLGMCAGEHAVGTEFRIGPLF